jgi:hypothetical protein
MQPPPVIPEVSSSFSPSFSALRPSAGTAVKREETSPNEAVLSLEMEIDTKY